MEFLGLDYGRSEKTSGGNRRHFKIVDVAIASIGLFLSPAVRFQLGFYLERSVTSSKCFKGVVLFHWACAVHGIICD